MDKQKGLAPILIVFLIALAVGGYSLYQKQIKPTFTSQPSPSPVATPVTFSPQVIFNWKIYTQYGISFNNPGALAYSDGNEIFGSDGVRILSYPPKFFIDVKIFPQSEKVNLKEWLDKYVVQTHADNRKYSIVRGEIATYKKGSLEGYTFEGAGGGGERLDKYVILQHEKTIIVFDLGGETGGQFSSDGEQALNQILSTFKFTN